jgi:hypothetical protein
MEDYNFFSILFMKNKLVTAVLWFGRHICNQAARIRVNDDTAVLLQGLPEPAGELPEPGRDRLCASLHCLQGGKPATQRRGETVVFVSLFISLLSFRIGTGRGGMGGRRIMLMTVL